MELRRFQQYVTLIEEGSFTAAAQKLHMAQSSLSASIAVLERDLGVELVVRSRDGVRPTAAGEAFLGPARATVAVAAQAKDAATGLRAKVRPLRVADTFVTVDLTAEHAAEELRSDWPTLPIEITQHGLRNVTFQVATGEVDVAFTPVTYPLPDGVDYLPLNETPVVLLCAAEHRLAGATGVTAADLAGETLILQPEGSALSQFEIPGLAHTRNNGLVSVTANSWINAISLARRGYGMATGPRYCTNYYPPDVAMVHLADPPILKAAIVTPRTERHPALADYLRLYQQEAALA